MNLRKYFALAWQSWQSNLSYRIDFVFWGISELITNIAWFFIWLIVYQDRSPIAGYSLADTITYFILIGFLSILTQSWIHNTLSNLISSGDLSNVLLKPIHSIGSIVVNQMSQSIFDILIRFLVYSALIIVYSKQWFAPAHKETILLFSLAVLLGVMWHYIFSLLVGCLGFWTVRTRGVGNLSQVIGNIFGGIYAPLVFFPPWFQKTATLLPFQYERYFAITIYLEKITPAQIYVGLISQCLWISIGLLVLRVVWKKGLKHYESVGV